MSSETSGMQGLPNGYDFENSLGVAMLLEEFYPEYHPTDAQFDIANNITERPGIDIINPFTKERLLITHGSSIEAETLVKREFKRQKVGATVLRLTRVVPEMIVSDLHPEELDNILVYQIPSGARLFAPALRDPAYNPKYLERLSFKLGGVIQKLQNVDTNLFGITINSVSVIHKDDDEGDGDDIEFAFVPPLKSKSSITNSNAGNGAKKLDLLTEQEFLPELVEAYRKGLGT